MRKTMILSIAALAISTIAAEAASPKAGATAKKAVKAQKLSDAEMKTIVAGGKGGVENAFRGFKGHH